MSTTKLWNSDDELFALVQRELFTCVVGDVMDKMELQHQFLPPQIQPLSPAMVVVGRAMPVLSVDVFTEKIAGTANKLMDKPFGLMLEALDDLRKNDALWLWVLAFARTTTDIPAHPRGDIHPSFALTLSLRKIGGRREGRVAAAPGAPAQKIFARARKPQVQAVITPAFPARWFTAYTSSPR